VTLATPRAGLLTHTGEQPRPSAVPFLICSNEHSGADLLAEILRSCGVMVFEREPRAEQVNESPVAAGNVQRLAEWVDEGSFAAGALVHWAEFEPFVAIPASAQPASPGRRRRPRARARWHTAFEKSVPGLRYLHVIRRDKAEQERAGWTNPLVADGETSEKIAALRAEDWRWIGFFAWARIQPVTVAYEDLVADRYGTVRKLFGCLGLDPPADAALERALPAASCQSGPKVSPRPPRLVTARGPSVSIVVVSHNEGENLQLTVNGIRATVSDDVEIIVVDDWSTDDSTRSFDNCGARVVKPPVRGGVTGARNMGAREANGDVLVFADAHIDPVAGWLDALCLAFADPSVACSAPTISQIHQRHALGQGFTWHEPQLRMHWLRTGNTAIHQVPFICGCLMAFRRSDFEAVGGFDSGMVRWGSEDAEIGLNLWRRGRASVVVPEAQVAHLFRPAGPYEVQPHMVVHNALRLATTHLPDSAIRCVIAAFRDLPTFPVAYAQLVDSDVWQRREVVSAGVRHDGAWFLDRFRIRALR
jgi:GT2 family glycosyltransferase/LPS sulfotransferase NodH